MQQQQLNQPSQPSPSPVKKAIQDSSLEHAELMKNVQKTGQFGSEDDAKTNESKSNQQKNDVFASFRAPKGGEKEQVDNPQQVNTMNLNQNS